MHYHLTEENKYWQYCLAEMPNYGYALKVITKKSQLGNGYMEYNTTNTSMFLTII